MLDKIWGRGDVTLPWLNNDLNERFCASLTMRLTAQQPKISYRTTEPLWARELVWGAFLFLVCGPLARSSEDLRTGRRRTDKLNSQILRMEQKLYDIAG